MTDKKYNYVRGLIKQASTGYNNLAFQQYMPTGEIRDITPGEERELAEYGNRLLPKIWVSKGTPLTELVASPGKQALGVLGVGALAGAGVGAVAGGAKGVLPGSVGGVAFSAIPAIVQYYSRKRKNENIREYIRRLPPKATARDMEADPVYQKELDRIEASRYQSRRDMDKNLALQMAMVKRF